MRRRRRSSTRAFHCRCNPATCACAKCRCCSSSAKSCRNCALASSTDARLEDTTARRCSRCDLRSRARSMVVGERGTGGSHAGGGGGWRVKEVDLDLELCGGYILSTLVVICVVMWCWRWCVGGSTRGGAVAWIYGDCLGEWMRKKMKSKTRCSLLLCCSVALLLLLPCTVNKNRSHVAVLL